MPKKQQTNSQLPTSDFQLRSEEVQEILTRVPHWLIRWGSVVVLTILINISFLFDILGFFSFSIKTRKGISNSGEKEFGNLSHITNP